MRKLENWIDSFVAFVDPIPSPDLFKKWVGIAIVAAVLERKVWVDVGQGPLHPNLYTVLVAPPGVGKTALTALGRRFLEDLTNGTSSGLRLGAASLTSAAIIDELRDAERTFYPPRDILEGMKFNALAIVSNELGVLLPSYEPDMMNKLTDIYDGHGYSERRRYDKNLNFKIAAPQINLLAATTPGYLTNMLPEGAWDMGFLSRTMLIFSGEKLIRPLFTFAESRKIEEGVLKTDLNHIFNISGEVSFEPAAKDAMIAWHMRGGPPTPDHPRLNNYNTRRTTHLLKLCMIAAAVETDTLLVSLRHFNTAIEWLIEAEIFMPDIFKAMIVGADTKAMDECWHFAYTTYMREHNRPVAEARILQFLSERVPAHNVMRMLEVMVRSGMLEKKLISDVGNAYQPKPRR